MLFSFPTFFVVFRDFYFCCKHYVTVRNTNYYLCVFSQFEIECVCFRVSVQLIEEKYCCDCLFLFCFCEFVEQDWDLTKKGGKCEKILLQFLFFNTLKIFDSKSGFLLYREGGKKPGASQFERLTRWGGRGNYFPAHKYDTFRNLLCSYLLHQTKIGEKGG